MSSTITFAKRAAAFAKETGEVIYFLFEQTAESNVIPHVPRWSCRCLGPIRDALKYVFQSAGYVETGLIRSPDTLLSAEQYIEGWLNELAAPVAMPDHTITLELANHFEASVPPRLLEKICTVLEAHDRRDCALALRAGEPLFFRLHEDAELLRACYDRGSEGGAWWRIIQCVPEVLDAPKQPALGWIPDVNRNLLVPGPRMQTLSDGSVLIEDFSGAWYCGGQAYRVMAEHIASLYEDELRAPGHHRARIRAWRHALAGARPVAGEVKILVDLNVEQDEDWVRRELERLPEALPLTRTDTGYEIPLPRDPAGLRIVTTLPHNGITWVLQDSPGPRTSHPD